MADEDFDIDIYGDADHDSTPQQEHASNQAEQPGVKAEEIIPNLKVEPHESAIKAEDLQVGLTSNDTNGVDSGGIEATQKIKSTDESGHGLVNIPKQAPQQQGTKRKEGSDDRTVDVGATTAILISDLSWWTTDDDIRGWVNKADCEDELNDITFSEHKVNGKSKGQAYLEFDSQQAATAAKQTIESLGEGQQYVKKHTVIYTNPNLNPFKTTPKDVPAKTGQINNSVRGGFENRGNFGNNNFRGRGGYNANRGNMNNMGSGFRGNFSGGMNNRGGFQNQMGFQGNSMGGGGFGGFNNGMMNGMRGAVNGMRGGRGGMNPAMMGMPMGNMAMGMGGMGMGMNNMGGGMPGAGFQGMNNHFNPAFFSQQQQQQQQNQGQSGGGGDWQNQHGAKRPRTE